MIVNWVRQNYDETKHNFLSEYVKFFESLNL